MQLSDFHYELPPDLIARFPLAQRSASRLLCLGRHTGVVQHRQFVDLVDLLQPGDLLVCNNTRVIAARFFGHKETGGRVEVFIERVLDARRIIAHVRASKTPKPDSILVFPQNIRLQVGKRQGHLFELCSVTEKSIVEIIELIGEIPLPLYFHRAPEENDKERYQTIYAQHNGSVAAPTAGLHFDVELFSSLQNKGVNIGYVTLHTGSGTFSPVRVEEITQHQMHAEYVEVSAFLCEQIHATKAKGGRVIAVGTTTARSLETAARSGQLQPFCGDTDIFIYPGFEFHCIDALITNFHLPCSTLLMLVTAFAGHENVMQAYQEAVKEKYRFFSYGDAMFLV
jgi:S-adenosylmethionine:tRNA ribosyltransferase-isomerase